MATATMKLSDAMVLGSTMEPMHMMDYETCALGVAMGAAGVTKGDRSSDVLIRLWPWLAERTSLAPHRWTAPMYGRQRFMDSISRAAILTEMHPDELNFEQVVEFVRQNEPEPAIAEGLHSTEVVYERT